jgi:predicted nuclease with TOPRIM domain
LYLVPWAWADYDAVLEILKKIQGSLAALRNGQADMRRDIRDLKSSNARILGMIGEMVKAHATVDDRFNALEARVERLEDRLTHLTRPVFQKRSFLRRPLSTRRRHWSLSL